MKDDEHDKVSKKSATNFAQMVKDAFHLSRKISRSGEELGEAWAKIDLVAEIQNKMFEDEKGEEIVLLDEKNFILRSLCTPSALHCLTILERFFHPVTSAIKDVNLNDFSLRFLVRFEKSQYSPFPFFLFTFYFLID